jgi:hypothetical protein
MSVFGYLICRTCKEQTCLGKWLRHRDDSGFGFYRGNMEYGDLGLKVLHFLARHTDHEVQVLSQGKYDTLSHTEPLHEYRDVEVELRTDWPRDAE